MCCIPYYLFCCCCCCGKQQPLAAAKPDFVSRFGKWIPSGVSNESVDKDPIPYLIQLYSCQKDSIENLATCRINPDLKAPMRRDLEFFIPQLCSFYLQGHFDRTDQLVELLVQASRSNFYFSQQVWFFFSAVLYNKLD